MSTSPSPTPTTPPATPPSAASDPVATTTLPPETSPAEATAELPDSHLSIVGHYTDYAQAQEAVDLLSDKGFPVEHAQIVGHNLRLVEVVAGRMTTLRAAGIGALSGAWFGLLLGLLFVLFVSNNIVGMLLAAILIGALWGALFGAVGHRSTQGKRDFVSTQKFVASSYDVSVTHHLSMRARQILAAGRD